MPATGRPAHGPAWATISRMALALTVIAAPAPVLAQAPASPDASPSPLARMSLGPSTDPGTIDILTLMPTQIDGLATEIMVERGQEHLDELDPDDPADAQERADIERFLEATGRTIDELTTASAVALHEDGASIVAAARVIGAEAETLSDAYVALLSDAMISAAAEPGQLGGKDVIILSDSGVESAEPVYVYAVADTVWLLALSAAAAAELLARLP
ncbi:hypothetical protein BH23CHL8_BH23CHL8_12920 [soil metagenome]